MISRFAWSGISSALQPENAGTIIAVHCVIAATSMILSFSTGHSLNV
jgi:hypothetical protein